MTRTLKTTLPATRGGTERVDPQLTGSPACRKRAAAKRAAEWADRPGTTIFDHVHGRMAEDEVGRIDAAGPAATADNGSMEPAVQGALIGAGVAFAGQG